MRFHATTCTFYLLLGALALVHGDTMNTPNLRRAQEASAETTVEKVQEPATEASMPAVAAPDANTPNLRMDMPMPGAMDGMNMEEGPPTEGDDNHRKLWWWNKYNNWGWNDPWAWKYGQKYGGWNNGWNNGWGNQWNNGWNNGWGNNNWNNGMNNGWNNGGWNNGWGNNWNNGWNNGGWNQWNNVNRWNWV
ncbi:hypothetical protein NSK_007509 [Nannochloropsis salina CCMP1776]|uniref:Uncharacterized protein n=1 Tax=Nannochloropsis salina CCMP1776 TaxID=1027361 RepID=A0A4D9CQV0_9STRA|nr:hypothetical protein NSK_007509 [Nannochloropsis salina CCMP1776]|eukprot:TFJ81166.1 hypothetical protein NSK_007509 [Nannochloropsis salina CCMP1776]